MIRAIRSHNLHTIIFLVYHSSVWYLQNKLNKQLFSKSFTCSVFHIGDEKSGYTLNFGEYAGTAG